MKILLLLLGLALLFTGINGSTAKVLTAILYPNNLEKKGGEEGK